MSYSPSASPKTSTPKKRCTQTPHQFYPCKKQRSHKNQRGWIRKSTSFFYLFLLINLTSLLSISLSYSQTPHSSSSHTFPTSTSIIEEILKPSLRSYVSPYYQSLKSAPHYKINVDFDADLLVYKGDLTLTFTNEEKDTLSELNFLLYPNSKELSSEHERRLIISYAEVNGQSVTYDRISKEVFKLSLPYALPPGKKIAVKLGFKGTLYRLADDADDPSKIGLNQLLQSLVHQKGPSGGYGVYSYGKGIVSMALWYPLLLAYDEKGWDLTPTSTVGDRSYFDVASYDVTLTTASDLVVATTGVQLESHIKGRDRVSRYVAGGVREFTIQASRKYVKNSTQVGEVTLISYSLPEHRSSGKAALREAANALYTFEQIFGPYPYKELELAESPLIGGAGGVEFPGLVTIGSFLYSTADQFKGKGISTSFLDESRDFVVAHEVAHQWWNAVVGSDSRTHPFVDEALANYSAAAHFHMTRGPLAAHRQIDMMMRLNYHLARLTGMEDQPVDQPTSAFKGMLDYGAIVYGKGALFFWELRDVLGVDVLHQALSSYYKQYQFKVAKNQELRDAIRSKSADPQRFNQLARRWLDERHGDEDIAGVSVYQTLKILMGDQAIAHLDPKLKRWANHRGVDALADLIQSGLTGDQKREVDYPALTELLTDLMKEDPDLARWAGVAKRVLSRPDAKPSDLLREAGREIGREDQRTGLILESMGLLLDALSMPEKSKEKSR